MTPPRLNRFLQLEAAQNLSDGHGGFSQSWQTIASLWAQIIPQSGRQTQGEELQLSAQQFRIIIRAIAPNSAHRPKAGHRLREGGRIFVIEAVSEDDRSGRYLRCLCKEEVSI